MARNSTLTCTPRTLTYTALTLAVFSVLAAIGTYYATQACADGLGSAVNDQTDCFASNNTVVEEQDYKTITCTLSGDSGNNPYQVNREACPSLYSTLSTSAGMVTLAVGASILLGFSALLAASAAVAKKCNAARNALVVGGAGGLGEPLTASDSDAEPVV